MIDLKFIRIRDFLPLYAVRDASGVTPRSLILEGGHFDEAQEILINGSPSPSFYISSPSSIIAQVPTDVSLASITSVSVLAESPSKTRDSVLQLNMGNTFRRLQGIERTVQTFVKLLLQTPGSDIFAPDVGGGLLSVVGKSVNSQMIVAEASAAVQRTRNQLFSRQNNDPRIPPDERLLEAATRAAGFDPRTTTLSLEVGLSMVSGQQAVANLSF